MSKLKELFSGHRERITMIAIILISIVLIFVIGVTVASKNKDNDASYNKDWQPVVDADNDKEEEATTSKEPETTTKLEEETTLGIEDVTQDQEFGLIDETVEPETPAPEDVLKYQIRVNRAANCITVYSKDKDGKYTVPYKAILCSTGKNVGDTPAGTFKTLKSYQWLLMVDGSYGQYAYRFYGSILFHSVPYFSKDKGDLEFEQFNKLGEPASLGCVRVCVRDAMWLIANCPVGTEVIVYDDAANPGPLGKPEMIKIPLDSPNRGWDPTDPDLENPWLACKPEIIVADTVTVEAGAANKDNIVAKLGAKAKDTCGNDITDRIQVVGTVDYQKAGNYVLNLSIKDAIGKVAEKKVTLTVKAKEVQESTQPTQKPIQQQPVKTYDVILTAKTKYLEVTAGEYNSMRVVLSKMGLSATDSKNKAIQGVADSVKITGKYDLNKADTYNLSLTITDSYGKTSKAVAVQVKVCKKEDPTPEDPTPEDPTPEDPTPEDPTPEDSTSEDPTLEDPTPENPTSGEDQTSGNGDSTEDGSVEE